MIKVSVKIDKAAIERKITEALEKQIREKLRSRGLATVQVKKVTQGGKTTFDLSGSEEDVQKAQAVLAE